VDSISLEREFCRGKPEVFPRLDNVYASIKTHNQHHISELFNPTTITAKTAARAKILRILVASRNFENFSGKTVPDSRVMISNILRVSMPFTLES